MFDCSKELGLHDCYQLCLQQADSRIRRGLSEYKPRIEQDQTRPDQTETEVAFHARACGTEDYSATRPP